MNSRQFSKFVPLSLLLLIAACANYGSVDGVDNLWREVPIDQFQKGVTTQSDVLELLGPPSQLISLEKQIVFYYLAQQNKGKGMILIVYNQVNEKRQYDRAIFFFGQDGVLQEVSYSKETIDR